MVLLLPPDEDSNNYKYQDVRQEGHISIVSSHLLTRDLHKTGVKLNIKLRKMQYQSNNVIIYNLNYDNVLVHYQGNIQTY